VLGRELNVDLGVGHDGPRKADGKRADDDEGDPIGVAGREVFRDCEAIRSSLNLFRMRTISRVNISNSLTSVAEREVALPAPSSSPDSSRMCRCRLRFEMPSNTRSMH
jgi:hypothetical protein